jgi:hypothetical protein
MQAIVIDIEGMEVDGHGADIKISNCCSERFDISLWMVMYFWLTKFLVIVW